MNILSREYKISVTPDGVAVVESVQFKYDVSTSLKKFFRQTIRDIGDRPAIPPKKKMTRALSVRHGSTTTVIWSNASGPSSRSGGPSPPLTKKTAASFRGVLCLAAAFDWIKC